MSEPNLIEVAMYDVLSELRNALEEYPSMHSSHEGFAVLKEELDELWDEVRKKPFARSSEKMRKEAKQVAAMAIRFMVDVCK